MKKSPIKINHKITVKTNKSRFQQATLTVSAPLETFSKLAFSERQPRNAIFSPLVLYNVHLSLLYGLYLCKLYKLGHRKKSPVLRLSQN